MKGRRIIKSFAIESTAWIDLHISPRELRPCHTLVNGQTFSWKKVLNYDIWIGVVSEYPLAIKQTPHSVMYTCLMDSFDNDEVQSVLHSYFQTDVCLSDLYQLVKYSYSNVNRFVVEYEMSKIENRC